MFFQNDTPDPSEQAFEVAGAPDWAPAEPLEELQTLGGQTPTSNDPPTQANSSSGDSESLARELIKIGGVFAGIFGAVALLANAANPSGARRSSSGTHGPPRGHRR